MLALYHAPSILLSTLPSDSILIPFLSLMFPETFIFVPAMRNNFKQLQTFAYRELLKKRKRKSALYRVLKYIDSCLRGLAESCCSIHVLVNRFKRQSGR